MKKILIISYFFPPCTLTAAQRPFFWAKYLNRFGYYPIIVTRRWDIPIQNPADVLKSSEKGIHHEKHDGYEVYHLPYEASIRDNIFTRLYNSRWVFLSKPFTLSFQILQNFSLRFIPYRNMFYFAKKLIKEDNQIQKAIISANPFEQFFFGYLLSKRTQIKWIADYRDDWTTSELSKPNSFVAKFLLKLEQRSEKKWVKTAEKITSVSPHYTNKIAKLVGKEGTVLLNGYSELNATTTQIESYRTFSILYSGTLYPSQRIEPFLEAIKKVATLKGRNKIHVHFPGLEFDAVQAQRVRNEIKDFESCFTITERIPQAEVIEMQQRSQLVLMVPHAGIKGIPSSKLFEYIGLQKSILLIPSDEDIIEDILSDCGLGYICNTTDELVDCLTRLMDDFYEGVDISKKPTQNLKNYSRFEQTKKLAQILDSI